MPKYERNQVGAVLTFRTDLTEEEVRKIIDEKLGDVLESKEVSGFDNRFGGPVFYIP